MTHKKNLSKIFTRIKNQPEFHGDSFTDQTASIRSCL